ncbi:nucleotide exchange factor GrpE [Sessilibacter corallicola]|uniref:Protein GrpE n=1 Tax=Sessilibacter corallicola TaxID=2904075 RepID=A0ABQ0ADF9_9GAMM|nr:nucleotide exchange factor GrpE [Sessilibacter corallicola]MCE2027482.1 nucleotide exchange factor GrpE [Sessilibacter corallicola]
MVSNEEEKVTSQEQGEAVNPEVEVESEETEHGAGDEEQALDSRIAELEDQLAQAQEQVIRAQAEVQNARRRAEQDVEKAHKFAVEKFANDMLPVADNLERAVQSFEGADEASKPLLEGVELTLKTLVDALGRNNLEVVDPEGQPFDPNLHQAMTMVENPDVEPNTVLNVFQKGYTLNGRLVRPAMVVVAKA